MINKCESLVPNITKCHICFNLWLYSRGSGSKLFSWLCSNNLKLTEKEKKAEITVKM